MLLNKKLPTQVNMTSPTSNAGEWITDDMLEPLILIFHKLWDSLLSYTTNMKYSAINSHFAIS